MGHGPGSTAHAVLDALAAQGSGSGAEMTIAELSEAVAGSARGTRAAVARLETRGLVVVNRGTSLRQRDDGLPVYGLWVSLPASVTPRTLQEILDNAAVRADQFENYEPDPADERPIAPMLRLRAAVQARAAAELEIAKAVLAMHKAGYSWSAVGMTLGTTAEAARQRYSPTP